MSMESAAVIGGVAVVNKLSSSSLATAQQSAISKLGKPGGQTGMKKTLDIFSEEDQAILSTITHGVLYLHHTHLKNISSSLPNCHAQTCHRFAANHIDVSSVTGLACMLDARATKTRMTAAATAVTQVMMGPSVAPANIVDACASMCARLLKCKRSSAPPQHVNSRT